MRMPGLWELKSRGRLRSRSAPFSTGTFPEPLAFSLRAWQAPAQRRGRLRPRPRQPVPRLRPARHASGPGCRSWPPSTTRSPSTAASRWSTPAPATERLTLRRWYGFTRMQTRVARACPRVITVSENSPRRHRAGPRGPDPTRMHVVPVGVDPELFRPLARTWRGVPGRLITTASADVAMKGLRFLLEALAKLRTERADVHLVVIGRKQGGRPVGRDHRPARPRRRRRVRHRRARRAHHRALLRGRAGGRAVALRGLLAAGHRGHGVRRAARGHHRRRPARGGRAPTATPRCWCRRATARPWPAAIRQRPRRPRRPAPAHRRRPAGARVVEQLDAGAHTAERTVEQYRALPASSRSAARGGAPMLTVDYDRLGLRAGRPPARPGRRRRPPRLRGLPARAPASWPATSTAPSCAEVRRHAGAMSRGRRGGAGRRDGRRGATATAPACRSPTAPSTGSSPPRCSSTSPTTAPPCAELARVLRPGGTLAVTVPAWLPEKVCWALSDEYHAPFVRGRPRPHLHRARAARPSCAPPGSRPGGRHHAHALHSPYWWLKCAVGPTNDDHPLVRAYHRLLVWDITTAARSPAGPSGSCNPVLGKSLVVYARRSRADRRRRRPATAARRSTGDRRLRSQGVVTAAEVPGDRRRHRRVAAAQRA